MSTASIASETYTITPANWDRGAWGRLQPIAAEGRLVSRPVREPASTSMFLREETPGFVAKVGERLELDFPGGVPAVLHECQAVLFDGQAWTLGDSDGHSVTLHAMSNEEPVS